MVVVVGVIALWANPDLVEAAARAGQPAAAEAALRRFGDWARHIGAPGPIGAAHRAATQLAGDLAAYARLQLDQQSPGDAGR